MRLILFVTFLVLLPATGIEAQDGRCVEGDCTDGLGVLRYGDNRYEGEFENHSVTGYGRAYADLATAMGPYRDGDPDGRMTYFYSDGSVHFGHYTANHDDSSLRWLGPDEEAIARAVLALNEELFEAGGILHWFEVDFDRRIWRRVHRMNGTDHVFEWDFGDAELRRYSRANARHWFTIRCRSRTTCIQQLRPRPANGSDRFRAASFPGPESADWDRVERLLQRAHAAELRIVGNR